ncbi:hypothetical protein W97_04920 [Coniosporium apollinis CBS 100218]|uniref:glucan endo-1,3-beta-D-glucosidase n=1 Tax=Coniosporium apollinis (strain CBS 100218) TaxID=1168221 RepID=R7YVK7_CONA1|nr:uncharacterized protein W97_04920 [Coniosporium apollinis CBS 100218]EON65681.1 hypothetical protein W97_04920 [Coniosporium apollinis CBS 100218]
MSQPQQSYPLHSRDETTLDPRRQSQSQQYGQDPSITPMTSYEAMREYDSPPSPPPHFGHSSNVPIPSVPRRAVGSPTRHELPQIPGSTYSDGRQPDTRYWGRDTGNSTQQQLPRRESDTTPGMDNLGERAAGGGIPGLALGVANTNERDSGVQALQGIDTISRSGNGYRGAPGPAERDINNGSDLSLPYPNPSFSGRQGLQSNTSYNSYGSGAPLAGAAPGPPSTAIGGNYSTGSLSSGSRHVDSSYAYPDNPYNMYSSTHLATAYPGGPIDPMDIADDGDDDLRSQTPNTKRRSLLSIGRNTRSREGLPIAAAGAVGGAATAGTLAGLSNRDGSGQYAPVPAQADGIGSNGSDGGAEKSEWLNRQTSGNKRLKWIVGTIIGIIILLAIAGGVAGGVLANRNKPAASHGQSAADDAKSNGDLSASSAEIKALQNPDLKKVFPGMDYTPLNSQYPDCMHNPPSQNNITRDLAVLSQLTPVIRLYGTDCNQTEMVLHAIDRLGIQDSMKVWLGVWLDKNTTTNARQISQMWSVLDTYGSSPFAGVAVGNEVLYREDLTNLELAQVLADTKQNFTDHGFADLPLATSDLGDNWTAELAAEVDVVMANVHPFFAGVTAEAAAGWTWNFWTTHDVVLAPSKEHVVSEVGWPGAGGNNCGGAVCTSDTQGSIAGIEEMNTFMEEWVCESLTNGTNYFWFEAFDEPWKVRFNKGDQNWEDQWGLMDVNRKLKPGVKIPDCGGRRVG